MSRSCAVASCHYQLACITTPSSNKSEVKAAQRVRLWRCCILQGGSSLSSLQDRVLFAAILFEQVQVCSDCTFDKQFLIVVSQARDPE